MAKQTKDSAAEVAASIKYVKDSATLTDGITVDTETGEVTDDVNEETGLALANQTDVEIIPIKGGVVLGAGDMEAMQKGLMAAQEKMKAGELILRPETGEYFDIPQGDTMLYATGICQIPNKVTGEGTIDSVQAFMMGEDGKMKLIVNSDIKLLTTVKRMLAEKRLPCLLNISWNGKKVGVVGKQYKDLNVGSNAY